MKSIAWAIVFVGILLANHLENLAAGRTEYTNAQGYFTLAAMVGFLVSLAWGNS